MMSKTPTPSVSAPTKDEKTSSTEWVTDGVQNTEEVNTQGMPEAAVVMPEETQQAVIEDETGATRVPANWALHREDSKLHALNLVTRQKYVGDVAGFNKLLRGE